jgi:gamma-glutamylcyclotransferase (GGCT)/AIG2-like uncharacterized protein YtfP
MPSVEESIRNINAGKLQAENELESKRTKTRDTEILLEFFAKSFEEFVRQIGQGKYDVNFPDIQKVKGEVSVEGLTALLHSLNELKTATKSNKLILPETQKVEGEVTVKNQVTIPEVKIPEYPKQIKTDVVSLPKYIGEKLDSIKKELSKIEVSPVINVENEAPQVTIDLEGVKSGLEAVVEEIRRIQVTPEVNIDLDKVISATDKTTKAINSLVFPVPNFHSSYDHSLSMRANDMDKTFAYTTDGAKKVIESITVRDIDGGQYIKTYTYSGDGTGDPVTESRWERV